MALNNRKNRDIESLKRIREESLSKLKIYREALQLYNEFKKMRELLGKPIISEIDAEKIRKDLSGAEFFQLIKEIRREKIGVRQT